MLYPLYVHQSGESAYGASFPDIPGCFTAADDLQSLPAAAQEAVEVHFEGEDMDVPAPGDIARFKDRVEYQDGFWMMVDIDLARVNAKPLRLNVSLPAGLVQRIDRYAESHHMSRSGFLASAAVKVLESA